MATPELWDRETSTLDGWHDIAVWYKYIGQDKNDGVVVPSNGTTYYITFPTNAWATYGCIREGHLQSPAIVHWTDDVAYGHYDAALRSALHWIAAQPLRSHTGWVVTMETTRGVNANLCTVCQHRFNKGRFPVDEHGHESVDVYKDAHLGRCALIATRNGRG